MAERLNNLAYSQQNMNPHSSHFNPRSISFNIQTPEELAAVNDFLITLGRDVSGQRASVPNGGAASFSPTDNFFDPVSLSQLGLSGMPGFATPEHSSSFQTHSPPQQYTPSPTYSSHTNQRSSNAPSGFGGLYQQPVEETLFHNANDYHNVRRSSNAGKYSGSFSPSQPTHSPSHYHHPTPPHDANSPHSSVSTPLSSTPPQHIPLSSGGGTATIIPLAGPGALGLHSTPLMNSSDFDFLRPSRGPANVPTLSPVDYMPKTMRAIPMLKSLPTSERPGPMEPQPGSGSIHRGPPAKLTTASASASGSLYPTLSSGGIILPPLRDLDILEPRTSTSHVLPPMKSAAPLRASTSSPPSLEHISLNRELPEDRAKHANLIKSLLVAINTNFKAKYGVPRATSPMVRAGSPMKGIEVTA